MSRERRAVGEWHEDPTEARAGPEGPASAVEDVQPDAGVALETAAPARADIIGVIPEHVVRKHAPLAGLGDAGDGDGAAPGLAIAVGGRNDAAADEGELRRLADGFGGRFTVAEVGGPAPEPEMHLFTEGETRLNSVLLPAFGFPRRPTSAITFSSNVMRRFSPTPPAVCSRGA